MSIEQEIVDWSNGRPNWQRVLIQKIVGSDVIDDAFIATLASAIVAETVSPPASKLVVGDLPSSPNGGAKVVLLSVGDVKNVNRLLDAQTLTLGASGLTIAYGDNGSGKSGYARIIKEIAGARHKEAVLPDAFDPKAGKVQAAEIKFTVDGKDVTGSWPDLVNSDLRHVHFYDEACGNDYLVSETELAYRPSVLVVFDALIRATDRVRLTVDALINDNIATCPNLPQLTASTKSQTFLDSLSAKTTLVEVDAAVALKPNAEEQLAKLIQEEARLTSTDPAKERLRLTTGSTQITVLATHFGKLAETLAAKRTTEAEELATEAVNLRKAADVASSADFKTEPLKGVGSETWRALWQAAEAYSVAEAYPEREFPCVEGTDSCPLCQQPILSGAKTRLERFHKFVNDETACNAQDAEAKARAATENISDITVTSAQTTSAISFAAVEDAKLAKKLDAALGVAQLVKERAIKRLSGKTTDSFLELDQVDTEALKSFDVALKLRADGIDDAEFKVTLAGVVSEKQELSDQMELAKYRTAIITEINRRMALGKLNKAKSGVTTAPMTTRSSDLARKYVTDSVKKHFLDECSNLGLEHVVLGDKGGDKGKLRHKPTLSGATPGSTPKLVLSEGEQTALGLAGLFTEVHFDDTKSAVVFDDPITSLDHGRREKVARRIVEIAGDRQVIVFTHDLTFLGDLARAADYSSLEMTERAIERTGSAEPGFVLDVYPWKAKDTKKRLNDLGSSLASLKKRQSTMTAGEYENEASGWAGQLSETWERIVRTDVVYKVVDRGTSEVRPKMFRMFAQITPDDDKNFQAGYSQCSKWVRRHDKSEEANFTAPSPAEMQTELDRAIAWQKRMASYAN